ncbi:hypothetical protein KN10_1869 [Anoxybacillus flavithermus NBRC 109594]|uniref:Type I restriction modification DNA specificity domain-containing protein n=1 Tax=Anoxybacillus flavithermus NBRC 109594 TaxID=1315967 RepID=R4G100_9BACL|nr:restriction endonuclease subunit S [Anoxybacillus flavithermus]GAC91433.1 hypothetical protein KN10_1869 [Anoxybacillus flavithermus NBRC 109594]
MSKTKQKPIDELLKEALVPEDEQPYEVPGNWTYFYFTSILDVQGGTQPPKSEFINEPKEGYIRLVQIRDFASDDYLTYIPYTNKLRIIEEEDILIARYGASVGRILTGLSGAYNVALAKVVYPKEHIYRKYLYWLLQTEHFQIPLKMISRSAQAGFNKNDLTNIKLPLPPYKEQKRIAEKIERLFAKIDEAKRLIEEVKKSVELRRVAILDRAIRGELVKQSSLDDSADILLEYIKMKRDFLVKQKKIHKEKNLPILGLDELRHNIPENWIWVRLGEVIELISGRDVSVKECNNDGVGVPYIMGASNIMDDTLIIERWIAKPSVVGKQGDILLSVKGTVGKVVIQEVEECHLSRQIMGLRPMEGVYGRYLKIFIQTYVQVLKEKSKGVIPGISREDILLAPFPLPPYNEQKRIAEKVDFLLNNLDREKEMVLEVEEKLDLLKQSILSKAFRGELGTNNPNDEHAIELLKEVLLQTSGQS